MTAERPAQTPAAEARNIDLGRVREVLPELIDALADAVVVVDRDRRVIAANQRYLEAFGAQHHGVAGCICHDALHCPELTQIGSGTACAAVEVFTLGTIQHRLRTVPDASGAMRRWEATFTPVRGADGQVGHVVEVWRDVTERTRLQAQISHAERLASLGMLAAGVAHEINNPLASVLAGVESLARWCARARLEPASRAEAEEVLGTLEREVQRCRETSDKLMLLAQPISSAPAWVDLNRACRDTLALLKHQMRKLRIEVVEELAPELPKLWARESGIRGVCMNLLLNAVQAMPEGGTLRVGTAAEGSWTTLRVEDQGQGIAPAILERIWDPFFTTKPAGQGTGLGLSITHEIVQRNGGRIRAENVPGGGARFVVELPHSGTGG